MNTSFRRLTAMAAGLAILAACSGEPTAPPMAKPVAPAAAPQPSLLGTVGGLLTGLKVLPGLQRISPLAAPITVTKTIGSGGGSLAIPQAGVTVTIPAGALSSNTVITMTARAGFLVAYDFAPHGITFAKPLVFQQKLAGTTATLLSAPLIQLGYYKDPSLLTAVGGTVSELLGGTVNLLSWTYTGYIKHFSGYMMGMGRASAADESSMDSDM